ncbi:MAG TPA: hypothetical protein VLA04_01325 [Verrucomicrobiae bacterium]|nr:hypothetical protein [Verrucomicrobiae bacterium]
MTTRSRDDGADILELDEDSINHLRDSSGRYIGTLLARGGSVDLLTSPITVQTLEPLNINSNAVADEAFLALLDEANDHALLEYLFTRLGRCSTKAAHFKQQCVRAAVTNAPAATQRQLFNAFLWPFEEPAAPAGSTVGFLAVKIQGNQYSAFTTFGTNTDGPTAITTPPTHPILVPEEEQANVLSLGTFQGQEMALIRATLESMFVWKEEREYLQLHLYWCSAEKGPHFSFHASAVTAWPKFR